MAGRRYMTKYWRIGAMVGLVVAIAAAAIWRWQAQATSAAVVAPLPAEQPAVIAEVFRPIAAAPEFYRDIKPIFDQRCVVCHGCYDAPCQLKLDSPEGLQRGASAAAVYDSARVLTAEPTRLFVDAHSVEAWRAKRFFSVLNESGDTDADSNLQQSVLYRMLTLKAEHPLPDGPLPATLDTSLDRKAFCPTQESFAQYARQRPLHGMPYGLPALSDEEFGTVTRWLEGGAAIASAPAPSGLAQQATAEWERFLNRGDLKTQLMSRYVYEHLFLADLYFADSDAREFFKLVRSRTPSGEPIDVIATRRPFDDPGVERVYYRLQPYRATIVAKTHLPYALDAQRMRRWQQLFLDSDYRVETLPAYTPEVAANPFVAFAAMPVRSRYRFLLDDANFFISTFIKGPVCRGQLALNVIDDQFWVMFANPDVEAIVDNEFLAKESGHLRLPSELEAQPLGLAKWKNYGDLQAKYLAAKENYLAQRFPTPPVATLDGIWNGDGSDRKNANAALTVFRHFDSASVVPGLIEPLPKTAWVIDYPMLERMYYLLAAGFDVYGDAGHQLLTRLYMDFLRMEGESNFLHFLPKAVRDKTRNSWYQGVGAKMRDSVYRKVGAYQRESGIHYRSKEPQRELFDLLRARLGSALGHRYDLSATQLSPEVTAALQKIATLRGAAVSRLPEVVLLRVVIRNGPDRLFSLLHNDAHSNVAVLLFEQARRRPERDTLSVLPGIVGAYPNAFWVVHEDDLPSLARDLAAVRSGADYRRLAARVAVTRNGGRFWQEADWALNTYRNLEPIDWGVLDLSRYER